MKPEQANTHCESDADGAHIFNDASLCYHQPSEHLPRGNKPLRHRRSTFVLVALFSLSLLFAPRLATAQQVRDFRSQHFLIHTDLGEEEAQDLLDRLETMLGLLEGYWNRSLRGGIECYIVDDLSVWDVSVFPHPQGLAKIREGAGVTVGEGQSRGQQFVMNATVYAVANMSTPMHEAVHAYCQQSFGRTGPTWYSEGMAELGSYWRENDTSVEVHPTVLRYLQESDPLPLRELIDPDQPVGNWQNYAWRWALCHLLANNPNYSARFRPFGQGLLANQDISFRQVYGAMAAELVFEYKFFLEHLEQGYRVDLCAWDWRRQFRPLTTPNQPPATSRLSAQRGWMPSGLQVSQGTDYSYTTRGTWKIEEGGEELTGDGDQRDAGRLLGIIMNEEMVLGEPFELGAEGDFTAQGDGRLYLRCNDDWISLQDNSGELQVMISLAAENDKPDND